MGSEQCITCQYMVNGKKRGEFVCKKTGYVIYIPADKTSCQYYTAKKKEKKKCVRY